MTHEEQPRGQRRFLRGLGTFLGALPFFGRRSEAGADDVGNDVHDYAFPFESVTVPGKDAADRMVKLRENELCVPVVLGDPSKLPFLAELIASNGTHEDALAKGLALDVNEWMRERRASDPDFYTADGPLSTAPPIEPLTSVREVLSGRYLPLVVIALCKVAHPWEVAAVLRPGGWNSCPEPEVHLAFFKRWYERYGAVVTSMTNDVIEFHVARPPESPDQAMSLAEEQFVYCADIVQQGVGSLRTLAAVLEGSHYWYFWWD